MQFNKISLFLQLLMIDEQLSKRQIFEMVLKYNFKISYSSLSRYIDKLLKDKKIEYTINRDMHPKRFPIKYYKLINN